jgi:2-succinyl-6-hydroxy-2,4-cyclohexadiene-1-carboxylate synthase
MESVELSGQVWRYQTYGLATRPALVLLHGFTGSHLSWDALARRWSRHYYVIVPDLPGHGQTAASANASEGSMPKMADRLSQLLQRLSIPKAAVLGYSMGGRLALHWAVRHGQQVQRLILESASPGLEDAAQRQKRRRQDRELAQSIEVRGIDWFVPFWSNQPLFQHQPDSLKALENRIRQAQSAMGLAQSLRAAGTGEQESLWPNLKDILMPVLLVTGSEDPKFCAIAEEMAQRFPNAKWVCVAQSGHTVHGEQMDRFYEAVDAFLTHTG